MLARPDGRVFYVGKGTGHRMYWHAQQARKGYTSKKYAIIHKISREGGAIQYTKVAHFAEEEDAYFFEQWLIRWYGRSHLANLTSGGDGVRDLDGELTLHAG